jgi:hemerythrin-like domain-containing protein
MKRAPELRGLSDDHHHGLVLALKAKRAGAGEGDLSLSEAWAEVEARFAAELAPHFQIEETLIAPALTAAGSGALSKRLYEEHRALRACVAEGSGRAAGDLTRFGELLESHIRFEERELFETAQSCMSSDALAAVAAASLNRSASKPSTRHREER